MSSRTTRIIPAEIDVTGAAGRHLLRHQGHPSPHRLLPRDADQGALASRRPTAREAGRWRPSRLLRPRSRPGVARPSAHVAGVRGAGFETGSRARRQSPGAGPRGRPPHVVTIRPSPTRRTLRRGNPLPPARGRAQAGPGGFVTTERRTVLPGRLSRVDRSGPPPVASPPSRLNPAPALGAAQQRARTLSRAHGEARVPHHTSSFLSGVLPAAISPGKSAQSMAPHGRIWPGACRA